MGGNFKVKSADFGADRISVIQALTVNASNAQTGSATVATQLIVRRVGLAGNFMLIRIKAHLALAADQFQRVHLSRFR